MAECLVPRLDDVEVDTAEFLKALLDGGIPYIVPDLALPKDCWIKVDHHNCAQALSSVGYHDIEQGARQEMEVDGNVVLVRVPYTLVGLEWDTGRRP